MSADRGKRLQHALARYLARWWPDCESNPNGRGGKDILGTPGVAFECKTARKFEPQEWARQTRKNAGVDVARGFAELPITVWFPDGTGEALTGAAMMLIPVEVGMMILEHGGWAPTPTTTGADVRLR